MREPSSLRQLLLRWLSAPLIALIGVSLGASYFIALYVANDAYDAALLDPALAIGKHLRREGEDLKLELSRVAIDVLHVDSKDRMFYRVQGSDGISIAGNAPIPPPPGWLSTPGHIFYNAELEGEPIRIAAQFVAIDGKTALVQVAETFVKRNALAKEILVVSAVPALVIAIAAQLLSWYGIERSLAPLERLREEIDSRSPRALHAIAEAPIPIEVRPVVRALNQLLERLKAAIEGEKRFIANAAHQLRTPLAGLSMHAELAQREPSGPQISSLLHLIVEQTERTSHLINQLLTLARADNASGLQADLQPVNLRDIATFAVQDWVPRALAKNIDLGFELEDAWTRGERLLLRELLANLLDNALAYTQAGGTVTVRTQTVGGRSVLEVQDNGPGIPAAERGRVFERFYHIRGTAPQGGGLGLAIVAEIAEGCGAKVELRDGADGSGTCARVLFAPFAQDAV
jgi:signal transduction histidine kinase